MDRRRRDRSQTGFLDVAGVDLTHGDALSEHNCQNRLSRSRLGIIHRRACRTHRTSRRTTRAPAPPRSARRALGAAPSGQPSLSMRSPSRTLSPELCPGSWRGTKALGAGAGQRKKRRRRHACRRRQPALVNAGASVASQRPKLRGRPPSGIPLRQRRQIDERLCFFSPPARCSRISPGSTC